MGMTGIMNIFFLYVGIKKKKQEGYRSWNGFIDTASTDMTTMTKLVTYGGDV